jgi:hypothetical protein
LDLAVHTGHRGQGFERRGAGHVTADLGELGLGHADREKQGDVVVREERRAAEREAEGVRGAPGVCRDLPVDLTAVGVVAKPGTRTFVDLTNNLRLKTKEKSFEQQLQ